MLASYSISKPNCDPLVEPAETWADPRVRLSRAVRGPAGACPGVRRLTWADTLRGYLKYICMQRTASGAKDDY